MTKQLPFILFLFAVAAGIYLEPVRKQAKHFNWCVESSTDGRVSHAQMVNYCSGGEFFSP